MDGPSATTGFVPGSRASPPTCPSAEIAVAAPPPLPRAGPTSWPARLLPVLMALAMIGMTAVLYRSGAPRNPMFLLFPVMMLVSAGVTALSGRASPGVDLDADRADYLHYLSDLRATVTNTATAQRSSLTWHHPDPDSLWTLVGGARMWERRVADPDFEQVRVGVAELDLATRLVPPRIDPAARLDPVTDVALRRFLHAHSTITDAPLALDLSGVGPVTVEGEPAVVRALLRAMVCQLAVLHAPSRLLIVGVAGASNRDRWDWLKWLPHNQHPHAVDRAGPVPMVYPSLAGAEAALAALSTERQPTPEVVIVVDVDRGYRGGGLGHTVLAVAADGASPSTGLRLRVTDKQLVVRSPDGTEVFARPDRLDETDALVCARRLAGYTAAGPAPGGGGSSWPKLVGIGDLAGFDPETVWRHRLPRDRLRVPIGIGADGAAVELDIKEAAENGTGPHGLCVGATGSGKSEFLRTIALGMMVRHAPDELNLVLVDFKGGATFLGLERAQHVAAVITNLADKAHLVARMHDALAGEMNRRQELLRAAGNFTGIVAYTAARRAGQPLDALPALFIVIDEFSELLSQHPDFADLFVAIGRLGRSLGMHLLLASQRIDEGRLRGLDAHLSYRVCLKTLSAHESRVVIGVSDAHELPNTPGAGLLRLASGELIRFQAAYVSGPCRVGTKTPADGGIPSVQLFRIAPTGPPEGAVQPSESARRSVLQTVLDRLAGHGPAARQVWLPPLGAAPALHTLISDRRGELCVPIGVIDCPYQQRHAPLLVDLSGSAGNVAVVGAPQSGKSTALCTLVTALAATHDPDRVQFYCLDFGGGTLAATIGSLPHVGSVASRAEPELIERTVAHAEAVIEAREARFRDDGIGSMAQYRGRGKDLGDGDERFGDVFLVIDGWSGLRQDFETLEARVVTLACRGLSFGVHVVVATSRWAEIRPAFKDQIGTRIELRLGDPGDSELDRRQARLVPHQPGRGLDRDGRHMVMAFPDPARVRRDGHAAPPILLLPARVQHRAVLARAGGELNSRILLGLEERQLNPVGLDFDASPHLLIIGDNGSGKTAALRTLCREIVRTRPADRAQLIMVDYRRSLLGVVDSDRLAGYAISGAALAMLLPALLDRLRRRMPPPGVSVAQLRARSWWSGPDVYLVVDDYDLVATATGNPLAEIGDYLPHAGDVGLHVLVARRSGGAARAMFEPLLAGLRDMGCVGLMLSCNPDEGPLLGSVRPRPRPPGRGTLITRPGGERLIQVAWSPP